MSTDEPLRVTYSFPVSAEEGPDARARELAREQTVEVPEGCFPAAFEGSVVGEIEEVATDVPGRARTRIAYSRDLVGSTSPQLLNVLYGNISMFSGVRLEAVDWPSWVLDIVPGPSAGIPGVRKRTQVPDRPLIATSVKPVGLTSEQLAKRCRDFVLGGIDVLKDDHSLADQPWAPFEERVARCQEAVEAANAEGDRTALYVPHLSGPFDALASRVDRLTELGCRAAMVHPAILGWDVVRWLAETTDWLIFTHPTFSGPLWTGNRSGFAPEILLGDLMRLFGADVVVYPNAAGRFPISPEDVVRVHERLTTGLLDVAPTFPMLGGGIDAARVGEWSSRFGPDTIFLVGSSLYAQGDLRRAAERLRDAVESA